MHLRAVNIEWRLQAIEQTLGHYRRSIAIAALGSNDEFIATHAPYHVTTTHTALKSLTHLQQQGIPRRMPQGIVYCLESVQVDEQHCRFNMILALQ